ncbi:hypothetical protein ACYRFT_01435 [Listeria kieliensis]
MKRTEAYKIGDTYSKVDVLLASNVMFISENDKKFMFTQEDAIKLANTIKKYFEEEPK